MIYMNKAMNDIYNNSELRDLVKKIVNNTKIIKECVVYDEKEEIDETKINFGRILKIFGDLTGYEVSCNEIRIDKKVLKISQIASFMFELDVAFSDKFSKRIVYYLQDLDDCFELRFHSFRKNEKMWLSDNLEKYDVPIICFVS